METFLSPPLNPQAPTRTDCQGRSFISDISPQTCFTLCSSPAKHFLETMRREVSLLPVAEKEAKNGKRFPGERGPLRPPPPSDLECVSYALSPLPPRSVTAHDLLFFKKGTAGFRSQRKAVLSGHKRKTFHPDDDPC